MATLEELKEANKAEAEAAALEAETQEDNDEELDNEEEIDESEEESSEESAAEESEEEEGEVLESEDWMKSDDEEEGEESASFSDGDMAKLRRKMKGKAAEAKAESDETIDKLEQKIKDLESGKSQKQETIERPKRDDFQDDDAYDDALFEYRTDVKNAKTGASDAAKNLKDQRDAKDAVINDDVNKHYERAAKLAEKSGIKAETYQAADMRVRQAVEKIIPGGGDAIVDNLISVTGAGSEKVFYKLGVNPKKLEALIEKLQDNSGGLSAAAYLGNLSESLNNPTKKTSKAPAPGEDIEADGTTSATKLKGMQKKYKEAHKSGDSQAAFNIKKKAKAAGADVKKW